MNSGHVIMLSLCTLTSAHGQILGVTSAGDAVAIAPGSGEVTLIGPTGLAPLSASARDGTGRFLAANKATPESPMIIRVDTETGDGTKINYSQINDLRAMAFPPDDDTSVLVVKANGAIRNELWRLDLTKLAGQPGFSTFLGPLELTGVAALAFAPDGTLFAWSTSWGLLEVDMGIDGQSPPRLINLNGLQDGTSDIQTIDFSPSTGMLYGMHKALFEIDPESGDYTQVTHNTDHRVTGMEFLNPCPADANMDGTLSVLDFVAMQSAFAAGDMAADCNEDGVLDILDFLCFQQLFAAGCPRL